MITVTENEKGLYSKGYHDEDVSYDVYEDGRSKGRSCFYEFGAKREAEFSGYSNKRSLFSESLVKELERTLGIQP